MTLPAAGWFPDPQDTTRLRWWDGHVWGDATRPLPAAVVEPVAPVVVVPTGPAFSVGTSVLATESRAWAYGSTTRRFCVFACSAVLLAVASALLNPWGVLSALAIVAGVLAVVAPRGTGRWRVVGRSLGVSALVVALATGIVFVAGLL